MLDIFEMLENSRGREGSHWLYKWPVMVVETWQADVAGHTVSKVGKQKGVRRRRSALGPLKIHPETPAHGILSPMFRMGP